MEDTQVNPSELTFPDGKTPTAIKHGYYSPRAAKYQGSNFYLTPDGREVECAAVFKDKAQGDENFRWQDGKYIGEVTEFVREGQEPEPRKERKPAPAMADLPEEKAEDGVDVPAIEDLEDLTSIEEE